MDSIEEEILFSLTQKEGIGLEELIADVNIKTGKVRQTIYTRLKKLMKKKFVEKRKRKYYLAFDSTDKKSEKEFSNQIAKLRKRTEKILRSTHYFDHGRLAVEIFNDWYVPQLYYKIFLESIFPYARKYKQDQDLKRLERMMKDLVSRQNEIVTRSIKW